MRQKMQGLCIQIVRFTDDHQPGWVECEFMDAEGRKHVFVDKVPIFTVDPLDRTSTYPQPGIVRCEVLAEWRDDGGRDFVRVSTARPDNVESTEGLTEFIVLSTQLIG